MLLLNSLANLTATGFGGMHRNLILQLLQMGVDVYSVLPQGRRADVHIQLGQLWDETLYHVEIPRVSADKFVLFSMWESTVLPQDWAQKVNDMADLLLVPSEWNATVFRDGGVTIPIEAVPLGINPLDFPQLRRTRTGDEPFTYLWQGFLHKTDRKGGNLVEAAFYDLIDEGEIPGDGVRLIMKSTPLTNPLLTQRASLVYDFRHLKTVVKIMPQTALLELLREADVSIHPTSGEGFGLIPLEHMATGLPVLAPCATGMMDYLTTATGGMTGKMLDGFEYHRLDTKPMDSLIEVPGVDHPGTIDRPYYDDVRAKMLWAYQNREALPDMGKRAAEKAQRRWTYRTTSESLLRALSKHFDYAPASVYNVDVESPVIV